jgi:hypothetical protein
MCASLLSAIFIRHTFIGNISAGTAQLSATFPLAIHTYVGQYSPHFRLRRANTVSADIREKCQISTPYPPDKAK